MTIDDLPQKDFASMTDEELHNVIRGARGRRLTPDKAVAAKTRKVGKARAKPKANALESAQDLMNQLTPAQQRELLKAIRGK